MIKQGRPRIFLHENVVSFPVSAISFLLGAALGANLTFMHTVCDVPSLMVCFCRQATNTRFTRKNSILRCLGFLWRGDANTPSALDAT